MIRQSAETGSCNEKDAVDTGPSAEDAGQERETHLFSVHVIGVRVMVHMVKLFLRSHHMLSILRLG